MESNKIVPLWLGTDGIKKHQMAGTGVEEKVSAIETPTSCSSGALKMLDRTEKEILDIGQLDNGISKCCNYIGGGFPTLLKNISQIGSFPQVGMRIQYV